MTAPDTQTTTAGNHWWLKHPKSGNAVLVVHEETHARCLSEGWTPTTDPRLAPDEPAAAPPSVPVSAEPDLAVSAAPADLYDLTAIGDSPEALAGALETAEVQRVTERNTVARAAFGIQTPPANAAPAPPVRKPPQRGGR